MKILWFVNSTFPAVTRKFSLSGDGAGGSWMVELAKLLVETEKVELIIASASVNYQKRFEFTEGGTRYIGIPIGKRFLAKTPLAKKIASWMVQLFHHLAPVSRLQELVQCKTIVETVQPEIVHIHGTENFYGLLGGMIKEPILISIQGILSEYVKYFWGELSHFQRLRNVSQVWLHWLLSRKAKREVEIFRRNHFFAGRTRWDRSVLSNLSPLSNYLTLQEPLRPLFYSSQWSISTARRHTIITVTSCLPYKGIMTLINAVKILAPQFPHIRLRVVGSFPEAGYGRYVRGYILKLGLTRNIEFLGYLEEVELSRKLVKSHVFVLPSHIENSPNSLGEAQVVGIPCIASFAGGVPSMVTDEETGLLFPRGDSEFLAGQIKRIFIDDNLAKRLSRSGRRVARARHDRRKIVIDTISAYKRFIRESAHN